MKSYYQNQSDKPGIYKILNISNSRFYIGSAKNFRKRLYQHLHSLKKGTHHNKFLQADFNKCGSEVFEFHVIEVVEGSQEDRLAKEQIYLDSLYDNQKDCYNFDKETSKNGRSCSSKTPEETIRKRVEKLKGQKRSEETKRKISEANKGKKKIYKSKETEAKTSATRFKKGQIPDNIEFLRNFNYHKQLEPERVKEIYKKIGESNKGARKNPLLENKDYLYDLYVIQNKSLSQIGKILNCNGYTVKHWLIKFDIALKPKGFAYTRKYD